MRSRNRKATLSSNPHSARLVTVRAPVTIEASAEGEGKLPTFRAVAYSGSPVSGATASPRLDAPYVIDLAGVSLARNVIVNLDHKPQLRVGHVTEHNNDKARLEVAGVLSADTPEQQQVTNSAARGFPWEVSSEFGMSGRPRKLAAGKSEIVNGQTLSGPLYIFPKSTFTGLAFVSHGADEGNHVTIAASAAGETEHMNPFEKFVTACGLDPEKLSDEQRATLQEAFDAKQSATAALQNDDGAGTKTKKSSRDRVSFAQLAEQQRREQARQDEIKDVALAAMKEHPMYLDQIEQLAQMAIESGAEPEKFELELLRATRNGSGRFQGRAQMQSDPEVIEAALCMAVGLPEIEKHYNEQTLHAVDKCGMRNNFSLQGLLMQAAIANGYSGRPYERITTGNLRSVLEYAFPPIHARMSGFSTVNLPGILGAVANKEILAGYMEEDTTWMDIASTKNVTTFHQYTSYRLLDNLEYEEVGPAGEIKHGTLDQESYTRQAKTYAKMLGITRAQIINDDLGAFDDLRDRLGRGGAKKFNNIVWAKFMDNASFFTTARTNYIEGATSNLGADGVGLGLAVTAYRQMNSPSADGSKRVGVSAGSPKILVVPPELEINARKLFVSTNFITGANATTTAENIFQGLYRPVVQDRLSDSSFTGNSTTAFYLLGTTLKPIVVSFLFGQRTPTVESSDADFDQLGIQFRGYHDFGADQAEYLAGVKSKGAA